MMKDVCGEASAACFFVFFKLKETQAFLLGTLSSPLSPKQQRNLEQVCA